MLNTVTAETDPLLRESAEGVRVAQTIDGILTRAVGAIVGRELQELYWLRRWKSAQFTRRDDEGSA